MSHDEDELGLAHLNISELLRTPEEVALYLQDVLETGDRDLFNYALGHAVSASGVDVVARRAGLSPEAVAAAISPGAKLDFEAIQRLLEAMGMKISISLIQPVDHAA